MRLAAGNDEFAELVRSDRDFAAEADQSDKAIDRGSLASRPRRMTSPRSNLLLPRQSRRRSERHARSFLSDDEVSFCRHGEGEAQSPGRARQRIERRRNGSPR